MTKRKDPKDLLKEGRKPKRDDVQELEKKIHEYFNGGCRTKEIYVSVGRKVKKMTVPVPTVSGLALYLGFVNRASMYDYEQNPKFTSTIKRAKSFMEIEYEEMLRTGNTTGAIFALKNFGRTDKSEVDHTSAGEKISSINVTIGK